MRRTASIAVFGVVVAMLGLPGCAGPSPTLPQDFTVPILHIVHSFLPTNGTFEAAGMEHCGRLRMEADGYSIWLPTGAAIPAAIVIESFRFDDVKPAFVATSGFSRTLLIGKDGGTIPSAFNSSVAVARADWSDGKLAVAPEGAFVEYGTAHESRVQEAVRVDSEEIATVHLSLQPPLCY